MRTCAGAGRSVSLAVKATGLTVVLACGVAAYHLLPGRQGPLVLEGAQEDTQFLGLSVEDSASCSANDGCIHMTIGACCPDATGHFLPCCNISEASAEPPEAPVINIVPPARPSSTDSQQCGHIFCAKDATCCETPLPEPLRTHNNTMYGICGAPQAKCCGLLVCGENAVCCHGLCLANGTACANDVSANATNRTR